MCDNSNFLLFNVCQSETGSDMLLGKHFLYAKLSHTLLVRSAW